MSVRSVSAPAIGDERYATAICVVLVMVFLGGFAYDHFAKQATERKAIDALAIPSVSANDLLKNRQGLLGKQDAPYTLVEFGDYECPPCRGTQSKLHALLAKYQDRVRFDFRNLPITRIHPYALPAAKVAESARGKDQFWSQHDRLFEADFSKPEVGKELLKRVPQGKSAEPITAQLAEDKVLAERLDVRGTPSFYLCRQDGSVLHLPNIDALETVMK